MVARLQSKLRVMLAMAVVLMTIMPAPVRHSHAGGERAHSHDADGHVHFSHDHLAAEVDHHDVDVDGCHSDGDHHDGCVDESHLLSSATSHQHYFWFGWSLSLAGSDDSDSEDESQHFLGWVGLAAGDNLSLIQPQASPAQWIALDTESTCSAATIDVGVVTHRALEPPRSNLLCDTARHERSGVQLI